MIAFLLVIFIVIYLNANVGIYGGGSDADDALKIGAKIVLNLDNPYRPKTYLGLPITPGLGALFLSIPLYLMENVSHQNSFWLFLLIFLIHIYYRDPSAVFFLLSCWSQNYNRAATILSSDCLATIHNNTCSCYEGCLIRGQK